MHKVTLNQLIYPVHQINGQRISGPPENLVLQEPSHETNEVYVTNLPRTVFEDTLLPLFSQCGLVYKIRLMMCFSGTNRGFVYVLFVSQEAAKVALQKFARFPLFIDFLTCKCRLIFAHKSFNKRILLMGNISVHSNVKDIIEFCWKVTNCDKVVCINSINGKTKALLLHYKAHYDAAIARRVLTSCQFQFGEKCYVKWHHQK